jgi:hypothetical protein
LVVVGVGVDLVGVDLVDVGWAVGVAETLALEALADAVGLADVPELTAAVWAVRTCCT